MKKNKFENGKKYWKQKCFKINDSDCTLQILQPEKLIRKESALFGMDIISQA